MFITKRKHYRDLASMQGQLNHHLRKISELNDMLQQFVDAESAAFSADPDGELSRRIDELESRMDDTVTTTNLEDAVAEQIDYHFTYADPVGEKLGEELRYGSLGDEISVRAQEAIAAQGAKLVIDQIVELLKPGVKA